MINNVNSELVYKFKNHFQKGENQIVVDKSIIPEYGVYFYTLKTQNDVITKKMLHLK